MTVNGTQDLAARGSLVGLAEAVADAVPSIVEHLRRAQPARLYREVLALMERPLLLHALALTHGNQLHAARLLGVNRNTLRKRCRDLGLAPVERRRRRAAPSA
jgi:two-component system nitrogen regulation response regulator GlnG